LLVAFVAVHFSPRALMKDLVSAFPPPRLMHDDQQRALREHPIPRRRDRIASGPATAFNS
jgi:hypothetical protein